MASDAIDARPVAAAANNAAWCHATYRAHGIVGRFDGRAWTSPMRSPPLYPDAVTLDPSVGAAELLDHIDPSAGCSIKDSFAVLDLAPYGFDLLFDATWIHQPPSATSLRPASAIRWNAVGDAHTLATWVRAWAGDEDTSGLFIPPLLSDPAVTILIGDEGDEVVAGAVLNESDGVVGISNVFLADSPVIESDTDDVWSGCIRWISAAYPERPIVGYETGADIDAAIAAGFNPVGPLRVWRISD
jgi:hypothetical protein